MGLIESVDERDDGASIDQVGEFQYDLFVSYRRSDARAAARWIRNWLLKYRPPRELGVSPRRPAIYLDEAYELATEDFFQHNIEPALQTSRYLLVVHSPDALEPRPDGSPNWVEREIQVFRRTPQGRRVLVASLTGELDGPLPGSLRQDFPHIQILNLRGLNQIIGLRGLEASQFVDPRIRWRIRDEMLKLVAPLYQIPSSDVPTLRQEEGRRQLKAAWITAVTSISILLIIAVLAAVAWLQRDIARERAAEAESRALAIASVSRFEQDPAEALLLAIQAVEKAPTSEALSVLAQSLRGPAMRTVLSHGMNIRRAAFSPDGRSVVTVGGGEALVWNLERAVATDTIAGVDNAVFSYDGRYLLTVSSGAARAWSLENGLAMESVSWYNDLGTAAISANWQSVTVTSGGAFVRNLQTGEVTDTLWHTSESPGPGGRVVVAADFSPSGRHVVTVGRSGVALIWDLERDAAIDTLRGNLFFDARYSPDGRLLITVGVDAALIWNLTGERATAWDTIWYRDGLLGRGGSIHTAAFDDDGRRIILVGTDGAVLWDMWAGTPTDTLFGHGLLDASFAPDGRTVVTAGTNGARIWTLDVKGAVTRVLRSADHSFPLDVAALSSDGQRVLTSDGGKTLISGLVEGKTTEILRHSSGTKVTGGVFSSDRRLVLTVTDSTGVIWELPSGRIVRMLRHSHEAPGLPYFSGAAFSPDGKHIVAAFSGVGAVGNLTNSEAVDTLPGEFGSAVSFSRDGRRFLSTQPGRVLIWSFNRLEVTDTLRWHGSIESALFSSDGQYVAAVGSAGAVVWDIRDGAVTDSLPSEEFVDLAISVDDRRLLIGGADGTVWIWHLEGEQLVVKLPGHRDRIVDVAFSSDGQHAIAVDEAGRVFEFPADLSGLVNLAKERIPAVPASSVRGNY